MTMRRQLGSPRARDPHWVAGFKSNNRRSKGCSKKGGSHRCMKKQPDELMTRARAGQADALAEICDHYRNYLRVVVRSELKSRLRERVELSDVVQEVLVEIVRQFPSFTGESEAALLGWMRRLVAQKLADLGRFHKRRKRGGGVFPVSLDHELDLGKNRNMHGRGRGSASRHPGAFPDEPERGGEFARADEASDRHAGAASGVGSRGSLAASRGGSVVLDDQRASGSEPKADSGDLGERASFGEAVDGRTVDLRPGMMEHGSRPRDQASKRPRAMTCQGSLPSMRVGTARQCAGGTLPAVPASAGLSGRAAREALGLGVRDDVASTRIRSRRCQA